MSTTPADDPDRAASSAEPTLAQVIDAKPRDLGGFTVGRVLPAIARRMVGPFTFLDEMGPAELPPGHGIDVRPHPHIGLATVTYLFDGAIDHRDSVGSFQTIRPGDINWMTAGRGIVHSERTPAALRATGSTLWGLQMWVALPTEDEEMEPSFVHHPAATIPEVVDGGARLRVLIGSAYGVTSPVAVRSPMIYVDAVLAPGATLAVPDHVEERAVYVVAGGLACGAEHAGAGRLLVFTPGSRPSVRATEASRVVILGGAPVGPRFLEWNFVASTRERLVEARHAWQDRKFPTVPGDEVEFIPYP